jgi:methylthioribose-1-phosphate isomerase
MAFVQGLMNDAPATKLFQIKTVWHEADQVFLLDQTLLPNEEKVLQIRSADEMWDAIKRLCVRGAPAIGVAAGYGVWIAAHAALLAERDVRLDALAACDRLATSRPTAVNLFWALDRMRRLIDREDADGAPLVELILAEADAIRAEDLESCRTIGRLGAELINDGDSLLTHCNAGALATSGFGTALAPMFWATQVEGKQITVFADETRPLLQGARLTAWELQKAGIPVTLICDSMAASVLAAGKVQAVIVGADRIAANGDVANKIGTYGLAVLARHHAVPFYVAAPWSTVDANTATGAEIPIEERHRDEIITSGELIMAPEGINVFNPAFDVTPAELVTAYITDRGVISRISDPDLVLQTKK